jgi:hypothetical protein
MTFGTTQRAQPRLKVRRGYPGNEPGNKSFSAPVTTGVTIFSGQIISLTSGAWVLGCAAGKTPYIAFHDSTDPDVTSAGLLLGFSCSGNYTFETAYFTLAAGAWNANDIPVIADTGSTVASPPSGAGNITIGTLTGGADILGFTTNGGQQNVTTTNSEGTPAGSPPVVLTVVFDTNWSPKHS